MLNIDLDMRVSDGEEVSMSLDEADEVQFGVGEAIVIKDHAILDNRDIPDQHPISAITGLSATLDELLDDIPTKVSQLQNDSGFLTSAVTSFNGSTGAVVYTAPVTSVNNKTGAVILSAIDVGALPDSTVIPTKTSQLNNDSGFITSASVPTKTSDLQNDSGFITGINSTDVTTALGYTPYNGATNPNGYVTTDNKTEQSYISNPSSYSYWRGLAIGANASQTENGALATTTDKVYVADSIRCQPSTGTIKATTFKGNLTGTASGNLVAGDLEAITTAEIDALFV